MLPLTVAGLLEMVLPGWASPLGVARAVASVATASDEPLRTNVRRMFSSMSPAQELLPATTS